METVWFRSSRLKYLSLPRIFTWGMSTEQNWFFDDSDISESVQRYEDMLKNKQSYFFDVHEFEDIIDYYLDSENFGRAAQAAEYASGMYPASTSIQIRIAEILIDKGQPLEALRLLNTLEKLEGGDHQIPLLKGSALVMLGKSREAIRQFEKAVSMADEERGDVLYNIGVAFERVNQYNMALRYFSKAFRQDPDNYYLYYDLAYCYERINELDKSAQNYQKYLDCDPFSEYVWYNLGIVYNRKEDQEKALEAYDYAIAINEDYASAYFNKANTLALLERYEDAIDAYREVLRIEPNNALAFCYAGESFEKLQKWDTALEYYEKSLSFDQQCGEAWHGKGVVLCDRLEFEQGILCMLKASAIDPDNADFSYALATAYANTSEFRKALNTLKHLIDVNENDLEAWMRYADVFFKMGEPSMAVEALTDACRKNTDDAPLLYRLAAMQLICGDEHSGEESLNKALVLDKSLLKDMFQFYPEAAYIPELIQWVNRSSI